MNPDPIEIALRVARVLEEQHVRYVVGGSLASSIAGEPRSTLDVDVIVELSQDKVATDPDRYLFVYTPEDILLQKLRWYQMGNEVSDRQWRDIMGIVVVQGEKLDVDYLRRAAQVLAVSDLLQRAFDQAGDRS